MDFYKFKFLTYRMVLKVSVLIMQNSVAIGETVAEIWQFFFFFSKWQLSPILDLLCACLDHPLRVFGGVYQCKLSLELMK